MHLPDLSRDFFNELRQVFDPSIGPVPRDWLFWVWAFRLPASCWSNFNTRCLPIESWSSCRLCICQICHATPLTSSTRFRLIYRPSASELDHLGLGSSSSGLMLVKFPAKTYYWNGRQPHLPFCRWWSECRRAS